MAAAADPIDIDIPDTSVTTDNPTAISFLKNFLMGVLLFIKFLLFIVAYTIVSSTSLNTTDNKTLDYSPLLLQYSSFYSFL